MEHTIMLCALMLSGALIGRTLAKLLHRIEHKEFYAYLASLKEKEKKEKKEKNDGSEN